MFVKKTWCKLIRNSRKEKTIEITIKTYHGKFSASAPSGKSKGKNEVPDYNRRGIVWSVKLAKMFLKNISNQNIIIKSIDDLKQIEDGIKKFEKDFGELGGNTVYAIEIALLKAAAKEGKIELWELVLGDNKNNIKMPMPVGNCIGGGMHSRGVHGIKPYFQEFELIPNEKSFAKAVSKNISAYLYARRLVKQKRRGKHIKNDENAWNTKLSNEDTLDVLKKIGDRFNLRIGLDVASSGFLDKGGYYQYKNKNLIRDRLEQIDYMRLLVERYNLFYIEDPLDEEDFSGFKELLSKIKNDCLVVGDDLTTTNLKRVERAVRSNAINAMIVKPNQIGSLLEVKKVMDFCKKNNIKTIFSHRSGETMDNALGDLAVGFQADFVKTGIYGKERLVKLARIIKIEKSLERGKLYSKF